ncbi:hypothetical protein DAPK24_017760 [Pichia kluyveri]|uniref:Mitochondrial group I intron splicing factor CCM1 n=1 Tax=Pichia kluyveri TaxID=36015 RepID=A0AAV5R1P3_PICKL|nr:hypothetical protein DAPK24_017760 [Pichia kluyveri]
MSALGRTLRTMRLTNRITTLSALFGRKMIVQNNVLRHPYVNNHITHKYDINYSRYYSTQAKSLRIDDIRQQLAVDQPEWYTKLCKKQNSTNINSLYHKISMKSEITNKIDNSSNLQQFFSFLCFKETTINENSKNSVDDITFKLINESRSIETAFMIVVHTMLKILYPSYENQMVEKSIKRYSSKYNIKPSPLFVSKEVVDESVFGTNKIMKIINNPIFQVAVQILKIRFEENKNWKPNSETRDDNILIWINSFFEPSVTKCLLSLTKSKFLPEIVKYDLLLRIPSNELEYKYFFEMYKQSSTELNLIDQEKLYLLKQQNSEYSRDLKIPPLFSNLFNFALRTKLDHLPKIVSLYLNENNISNPHTLEQIGEILWQLSFDHTGEHLMKPSKYCNIAHSKLVTAVNTMTSKNSELEVDVTTMIAVSNMIFYKDFRKSFQMFKNAKRQFDHWKLQNFKPKEFQLIETDTTEMKNTNKISESLSKTNVDINDRNQLLYSVKVDYNIKFLCNSILLLAVNESNEKIICQDLLNIFKKVEPEILKKYPEIWQFVIIKLNYHNLVKEHVIGTLFHEYLKYHEIHGINNYSVLDLLINKTTKPKTLFSIIENLKIENLDDNNRSHLVSKLYKISKNQTESEKDIYNCLEMARKLYDSTAFKSTRMNSAHLLGESLFSPEETFNRYNNIATYFQITQLSISALFVSVYKLHELGIYDTVKWGQNQDIQPLDFAMTEFKKHISRAYGDTNEGLLYPNDSLLTVYINVLKLFKKDKEIQSLLNHLVDLKYPIGTKLFEVYLQALGNWDRTELLRCLNEYDERFERLRQCKTEYELKRVKSQISVVKTKGAFEDFIDKLEFNWEVVRRWRWPGRKA